MNAVLLASLMLLAAPPEPAKGLRAPPGFEVTEYAASDLANDISCMTIDTQGRIIVAGRGFIRTLIDADGDGRADRAVEFSSDVKTHPMGLLWETDQAFAVCDGGLWRYPLDKEGKPAGPRELVRKLATSSDHHAHAVQRGPDGWLYLIAGDSTQIDSSFATLPTSPIKKPNAGCIVRFTPDLKHSEIVAHGFRNPYAFDFDRLGNIWTFDADNERCVSLPWQEGTRLYKVVPGGHHGWRAPQRSETWRCPPYFFDVVPPIADLGRGSPTGVAVYKHLSFPSRQRGVFVADWTFGKIWRYDTFFEKLEVFLESTGDNGFAPTALAVHPKTGDLFISIGGRGTRGAVYRVHWPKSDDIDLSDSEYRFETFYDAKEMRFIQKLRPPYLLPYLPVISPEWKPEHAARLCDLATKAHLGDEYVRALVDMGRHADRFAPGDLIKAIGIAWRHWHNRRVIVAAAGLVDALPWWARLGLREHASSPQNWVSYGLGLLPTDPDTARLMGQRRLDLQYANRFRSDPTTAPQLPLLIEAVRLIQLAIGDLTAPEVKAKVWAGYSCARPLPADRHPALRESLRRAFPSGDHALDRELSRTLAVLEDDDPKFLAAVVDQFKFRSDPIDDIHYLIVLSRLPGPRSEEQTSQTAFALLMLDEKLSRSKRNRDRNWPLRIAELHVELSRKDPKLNAAILHHTEFGRPDHVLFTRAPGFDRRTAAERFHHRAARNGAFAWNGELVALMGELPADVHLPLVRTLWDRGLDEAVLPLLVKTADAGDAERFLSGLTSPRLDLVRRCLEALAKVPARNDGPTSYAMVRGLRLLPEGKEGDALRTLAGAVLRRHTGANLPADKQAWTDWLAKAYPDLAKKLGGADGVDLAAWKERLARVDWSKGDADRGRAVFTKASCASCHSGSQAMGPDLIGVAGRFSRDDLFTAIVQPSKDIPSRYRTTQIDTTDGKTYQGMIVYEAVDGLILQTGSTETVRIAGERIESKRLTTTSLMPSGLLDKLADREIADLYEHLRGMKGK